MNLAFVVKGQPGDLRHLDSSFQKIKDVLEKYANYKVEISEPCGVDDLTNRFTSISEDCNNVNNFIFYYIGHGEINYIDTRDERFEFKITEEHTTSLKDILLKIRENINPNNIFIIVDACKSGKIIEDLHSSELQNTYLLSSSSKTELSYEDDTLESTRFTYYFCEAFIKTRGETFKDVEGYIIEKFNNIDEQCQTPHFLDPYELKKTKIIDVIKKPTLLAEEDIYITVELIEVDELNFKFLLWIEDINGNYKSLNRVEDSSKSLEEIIIEIDLFLSTDPEFKDISSDRIFLLFALPKRLMANGLCDYKLENSFPLSKKYTILLRAKERFRDNTLKSYRLPDWESNWNKYISKQDQEINSVFNYQTNSSSCLIHSRKFITKPLVGIGFEPDLNTFENLYNSATPVALWTRDCNNFDDFKAFIEANKKLLGNLHKELFELQPEETGLKANILMLYDNPKMLPLDEQAPLFMPPQ